MSGSDYSSSDFGLDPEFDYSTLKKPQALIDEGRKAAAREAAAFQAKSTLYHGLTDEEVKVAKEAFNAWYASPAGHSGLDMGDILTTPDDALLAWLALTALIKNTKGIK